MTCSTGEREGEDEAEDEEAESGSDQQRYAYIDELGKKTLESEEACANVIEQLRARLEEVYMLRSLIPRPRPGNEAICCVNVPLLLVF